MIIISHRGNLTGPNTATHGENHPDSLLNAVDRKLHVEADIQDLYYEKGKCIITLGHDGPEYKSTMLDDWPDHYLDCVIFHCKNVQVLSKLHQFQADNYNQCDFKHFFHGNDDATLTSNGWIWLYPNSNIKPCKFSIRVLPELHNERPEMWNFAGVCTDYPISYQRKIK